MKVGRARKVDRQLAAGALDGGLHIRGRGIDSLVEIELERDLGVPCVLELVVKVRPGICVNCFSSGVAIVFAIVSGLAPGYERHWMTG